MLAYKIRKTKNYTRIRIEDPKHFKKRSFRIIDPGRKGHTKLIIGRLKGSNKTRVQALLEEN